MKSCTRAKNQLNSFYANDGRVSVLQKMEKAFICDSCDQSSTNKRNRKRHRKKGYLSTTVYFVCDGEACTATFLRRGYLRDHLKNRRHFQPSINEVLVQEQLRIIVLPTATDNEARLQLLRKCVLSKIRRSTLSQNAHNNLQR